MRLGQIYGSRPDLPPPGLARPARGRSGGPKATEWVGRPGVELLGLTEYVEYEEAGLRRFPRGTDRAVRWAEVRPELVIESAEASVAGVEAALLENGGGVVIAWGSLALPAVRLDAGIALAAVPAMVTRSPEFWIYWPGRRLLLENSFDGSLHLAQVPQTAGGRRASTPHAGQPGGGPPGSPPTQPPAAAGAPSLLLGAGRPRTAENVGSPR